MKNIVEHVPRYFEPYVNDCFATAYGACLAHLGHDPRLVLADYLSFMFDPSTNFIGTTFMYRFSTSVEFTEAELNSSLGLAYFPETTYYDPDAPYTENEKHRDKIRFQLYIHDDSEVAAARLKELIDSNKAVAAVVDLYYMSYHRAYMKEHGLHAIVITGYDEEKGVYHVFDKYLLSSSDFDGEIPMEDIITARLSDVPRLNPIIGEYRRPIRNLWMEFDAGSDYTPDRAKLLGILRESYSRMSGREEASTGYSGLRSIEEFRQSLLRRKEHPVDTDTANFFKEYYNVCLKRVARGRNRFRVFLLEIADLLPQETVGVITEQLAESAKRWDICANLSLKLAISKSVRMYDDLDRNVQAILEIESAIVEQLRLCEMELQV
ncbi:BtrH N-terminal domain-containing protein [Paenibacillus hexagrammi]|uniref:BtrH N-terminal domain-containing protein n=1 Tax=Paenibacillus hexagrammi TaxID=2908839 RepID=A0ABY3SEE3_9BACL|nr:BtrH N-terminal domain-containing protein [Paenibacillus sp. YPD9-1]UJF32363.1 BtrH N-terminal domain-containing protein [Paenibacillus sp. YPD9-1]